MRDVLVPVFDTLSSRGGMSDLRIAAPTARGPGGRVGGGFHILTGSNRVEFRRLLRGPRLPPRESERPSCRSPASGSRSGRSSSLGPGSRSRRSRGAMVKSGGSGLDPSQRDGPSVHLRARCALPLTPPARARDAGHLSHLVRREQRSPGGGRDRARTIPWSCRSAASSSNPRRPYHLPMRFGARYATNPVSARHRARSRARSASRWARAARFAQHRGGLDLVAGVSLAVRGRFQGAGAPDHPRGDRQAVT